MFYVPSCYVVVIWQSHDSQRQAANHPHLGRGLPGERTLGWRMPEERTTGDEDRRGCGSKKRRSGIKSLAAESEKGPIAFALNALSYNTAEHS